MNTPDLDAILDRILIASLFNQLTEATQKDVIASAYNLIDHAYGFGDEPRTSNEQVWLHQRLCERLLERLPEGRQWSKSDLLNDY